MLQILRIAAGAVVLAAALWAGDCLSGSDCANCCPLAQEANHRFATGHEAVSVSPTLRADFVRTVLANLDAI